MRGSVYLLCGGRGAEAYQKTAQGHMLDFVARQQRRVVRATFSAELLGSCDTIDRGILLAQLLHEISTGDNSITGARQRRENGGYNIPAVLYLDAMSVYAAVTASYIKIPADNAMLSHVQYLRELLDQQILDGILWTDTRDMIADGATKGAVDRSLLHECMAGNSCIRHEIKLWQPKVKPTDLQSQSIVPTSSTLFSKPSILKKSVAIAPQGEHSKTSLQQKNKK